MAKRILAAVALAMLLAGLGMILLHTQRTQPPAGHQQAYADPASCIQCHADAAAGYAATGMAHAFYQPHAGDTIASDPSANNFYHAPSATFYSMVQHDGKFFQRRWQKGFGGSADNIEELQVDYVMGSGNHARTYLHRDKDGSLIELPVAWYAEKGGHLGMNPGFDNPDPATHQVLAYECMFCHNAYPQIPELDHRDPAQAIYTGALPEGIDCQRCHGPGERHVEAARAAGTPLQQIRSTILNPELLTPERQMEVCEQCHLETTSRHLPDRIRRYEQEPFGYDPSQPLENFNTYFERSSANGGTDNFEIVSSSYRLRQSRCFMESKGALTCETCHDPHDLHKGPAAAPYYAGVCMQCHAAALPALIAAKKHPASNNCVSCHMPLRRTEDVIHAVMTDHKIQLPPPSLKVLLAERQEISPSYSYHGEVRRYRLSASPPPAEDSLYTATAQVMQGSNLEAGIPWLAEQIRTQHPARPEFSIELGDALHSTGNTSGAIDAYRQALAIDPLSSRGRRSLAIALAEDGKPSEALSVLGNALQDEPENPTLWYEKALIEAQQGNPAQAIVDLHKTLDLKPDMPEAQNNLGIVLLQTGDDKGAEAAFRAALVLNPYTAAVRANLGRLLAGRSDWQQAAFQLKESADLAPAVASTHSDYASVLIQLQRLPEAQQEAELAVKTDPASPQAHDLLGQLLAQKGQMARAGVEFASALQRAPDFASAQLDLGLVLLQQGDTRDAIDHLQHAERSSDPDIAGRAHAILLQMHAP